MHLFKLGTGPEWHILTPSSDMDTPTTLCGQPIRGAYDWHTTDLPGLRALDYCCACKAVADYAILGIGIKIEIEGES